MLRDVFYYGKKPNVHPKEKFATSLEDARKQANTEHFWIINEYCDYRDFDWGFDFEFLPDEDVWAEEHINVWPSEYQKDSGTWLCNTDNISSLIIYRADVGPVKRKNEKNDRWIELDSIDHTKFNFSWHPDPTDPPYIYKWGSKFAPVQFKTCLEYHVLGATEIKYMDQIVELLPNTECWVEVQQVDKHKFDMSWRPNPMDPPMIYIWGNQYVPAETASTLEYHVPGGIEKKFMPEKLTLLANMNNWDILESIDKNNFDFAWIPDPTSPPYIYAWGNQWNNPEDKVSIQYVVEGATEYKYMEKRSTRKLCMDNWFIPNDVDVKSFDFSWEPSPADPAYIYEFGTQHQKTGGPQYIVEGATEKKYIDFQKVKALPNKNKWVIPDNIDATNFDFSWHPDSTDPGYIYQFGTQWALSGGPKYVVDDAKEIKYMDTMTAIALPNKDNWEFPPFVDSENFDYSWHPYAEDEPYVYQFGTQHQKTGGPKYLTPGIHKNSQVKYIDPRILKSTRLPSKKNFATLNNYKVKDFNYSWHPDTTEEPFIYVFGNQHYSGEIMPTIEYVVPGAKQIKYVNEIVAILDVDMTKWEVPKGIDTEKFDFSWVPNPKDPPYIYQFGTQWQKTGGPRYIVDDATEIKYVEENKATSLFTTMKHWEIPEGLDISDFDFSWHPDATEKPYIYVFGTQWALTGGPKYNTPGATEVKYVDSPIAKAGPSRQNWIVPDEIAVEEFDFSWHPYVEDQPYIYQFGTQWQKTGGPQYITPGSDEMSPIKYVDTRILKARRLNSKGSFSIVGDIKIKNFDYSWHPDATEQPYIYVFGNQWHPAELEPTIEYHVQGATTKKYIHDIVATAGPDMNLWDVPKNFNKDTFDFSWRPDPTSPPYVYQFGSLIDRNDGPKYNTPNNDGEVVYLERKEIALPTSVKVPQYYIETTLEDLVNKHPNEIFWALNNDIDYEKFDFDWRPQIVNIQWENEYVYVFGSPDSIITQTYFVNASMYLKGNKDFKFIESETISEKYLATLFKKSDMFFVDKGNKESQERFDKLKQQFPTIQKTRYLNTWVDTINRCINRSTTNLCWILNSELVYDNFDFDYYPNPWQMKMVQVFGTQWSHWGTTFMVNRDTFANDTKYVKVIEHLNNLNFIKDRRALSTNILYDKIYIDHGNKPIPADTLVIQYEESYLNTFKKLLSKLPEKKEHFVWVTSSICDYTEFDFTYICDPFAREQLHVFPSDKQKFGDTFLINVNKLRELISDMTVLEDYNKVNYNQHQRAKRLPSPIIITEDDTHVSSIDTNFDFPYATFVTADNKDIQVIDIEPMSVWDAESKTIQVTSVGGTRIIVPKEIKQHFKRELYDYPYISTNSKLAKSTPMDIVFLSNGETGADENYDHLVKTVQGLPNRVVRVDGVKGRVQAYHAAAEASNTPWMFTVFAKLKVSNKFDWNWQPDRLQVPKHYVFHAKNPVNGLVYGHQAMIAYNKKLTLANKGKGLDFTMDDEHEVLEINSGSANFNTDEWSTWRTSFREALKLRANDDQVSKDRLDIWLTVGMGKFNEYSMEGAQHAVEYYKEVNGDFDKLKLSYDWEWLKEQFNKKYK
jgi:hypothetical protein